MKVLTGNITKCGTCGCSLEYNKGDIITAIECPTCKGLLKVDMPPAKAPHRPKQFYELDWLDIACAVGRVADAYTFPLGATKTLTLKNGEAYELQVVDRRNGLVLGFRDLYGTDEDGGMPINSNEDYNRPYKDSDLRKWLNGDFYDLLPDDFKKVLSVAQVPSGGEILEDMVFIPSETEYRGELKYGECEEGAQFELYKDWHNRIAGYPDGDYGRWHWHRTKVSKKVASANCFCICSGRGNAGYSNANGSGGVRPHFLIKAIN